MMVELVVVVVVDVCYFIVHLPDINCVTIVIIIINNRVHSGCYATVKAHEKKNKTKQNTRTFLEWDLKFDQYEIAMADEVTFHKRMLVIFLFGNKGCRNALGR